MLSTKKENQTFNILTALRRRNVTAQLPSKKCLSGDEPMATLPPDLTARDLNFGPPAPGKNALPLDQLAGYQTRKIAL